MLYLIVSWFLSALSLIIVCSRRAGVSGAELRHGADRVDRDRAHQLNAGDCC